MPKPIHVTFPVARPLTLWDYSIPLGFGLLFWAAEFWGWEPWLEYQRHAIAAGEWWRLWTGNLVHLTWAHLFFDYLGFLFIWYGFRPFLSVREWLEVIGISGLAVGLGMWGWHPEVGYYLGISGVLHGMFVVGIVRLWQEERWIGTAGILLLVGKLIWEQTQSASLFTADMVGAPVLVDAHLYGAIGGVGFLGFHAFKLRLQPTFSLKDKIGRNGGNNHKHNR